MWTPPALASTSLLDAVATVVHQLFAALWIGSVALVALAVPPLARDGKLGPDPLRAIVARTLTISRASALLLLVSGAHSLYWDVLGGELSAEPLTAGARGYLVVAMVVLWFVLAVTVVVASRRIRVGLDEAKLREPAHAALPLYRVAAVVGVLLAVVGGPLSAGGGS